MSESHKIDLKHARDLTADEITAGCVQILGVSKGALVGKQQAYHNHRAIWYAVLRELLPHKMHAVCGHVERDKSRVYNMIKSLTPDEVKTVRDIVAQLQVAEFQEGGR